MSMPEKAVKSWCVLLLVSVLFSIVLLLGCSCTSGVGEDVRGEVVASLMRVNQVGLDKIDAELDKTSDDMYRVAVAQEQLKQVLTPALEWVELQKTEVGEHAWGTWDTKVFQEGLTEFKNDRYRVSTLGLLARGVGTSSQELITIIKITDLDNKLMHDWDKLDSGLKNDMAALIELRQAKLSDRKLVADTLTESIAHWQEWEIKKVNDTSYTVSGTGLGWVGGLAAGTWTYNRYSGTIKPEDSPAKALEQRLEAKL